jgi:Holliday junction resolvase-like predicted endonuclease
MSRIKLKTDRKFRHPAESAALEFLESRGHTLICHNFMKFGNEFDLITKTGENEIHFTEVKSWKNALIHPVNSINQLKRERLRRLAGYFISEYLQGASNSDLPDVFFDLLWIKEGDNTEYFERIF